MAIRLQGLAAPERDEPGGPEAAAAMKRLVHGREVRCELDGERTYDRCAAVCYVDGLDVAEVMIRGGYARDCPRFSQGRYAGSPILSSAMRPFQLLKFQSLCSCVHGRAPPPLAYGCAPGWPDPSGATGLRRFTSAVAISSVEQGSYGSVRCGPGRLRS